MQQQTLRQPVTCDSGIGVHSGSKVKLSINPADINGGIVFKRTDITTKNNEIKAHFDNVIDTNFCTKISNDDGVCVSTIEHLMAALYACGIDNAVIEIDNEEIPIMDGSSIEFIKLIENAGIIKQKANRRYIKIIKPVIYRDDKNGICAELHPNQKDTLELDISFDFKGRADFPKQNIKTTIDDFKDEIAKARTFGLKREVEYLKSMNLARGGSLDNAVVVDGDKVLNKDGLRFADEFVRHKALDAIGDLYTSGHMIIGLFKGDNCGHGANNELLKKLFLNRENYEIL